MKRVLLTRIFIIIFFSLIFCGYGCGTTNSAYRSLQKKITSHKPELKKRILVLNVLDQAGVGKVKIARITDDLIKILRKENHFLVYKAKHPIPTSIKIRSPKFGIVIDPDISKKAEEIGVNVLITGVLNPFEITTKKTWFWPFRKIRREVEVSMAINALDVTNGTLFLTNLETRKSKLPEDELEEDELFEDRPDREGKDEIDPKLVDKELSRILKAHASKILANLNDKPWSGRTLSADRKTVIINAGKNVGVNVGHVFEVFSRGESINSVSGRPLFLLGPKTGEIKIDEVRDSYSSATPLNDGNFTAGQIIRLKN